MFNKKLDRPEYITDDVMWDLLSKLLVFDRKDRFSSSDALKHPFFTSQYAHQEITAAAIQLAQQAKLAKQKGDLSVTLYDTVSSFSIPMTDIQAYVKKDPEAEMVQLQQNIRRTPSQKNLAIPVDNTPGMRSPSPKVGSLVKMQQKPEQQKAEQMPKQE